MRAINIFLKILPNFFGLLAIVWCMENNVVSGSSLEAPTNFYKKFSNAISPFLPFQDCGSEYDIIHLTISSCNSIPCQMSRGSTVLVNVIFNDNGKEAKFLKHSVKWIFMAVVSNAMITPDPCDGGDQCITKINDGKSYWASVFVNSNLPVISGTMLWEAVDDRNVGVICFKVPVIITT